MCLSRLSQQALLQQGVINREILLSCLAFAWFQNGLAVKQTELLWLIFALCCPNMSAYTSHHAITSHYASQSIPKDTDSLHVCHFQ